MVDKVGHRRTLIAGGLMLGFVLLLTATANAAHGGYPNAIAVLGHSGATGESSDPNKPLHYEARENSWATGTNPAVKSLYRRLLTVILRDERLVVGGVIAPRVRDDAERLPAFAERQHLRLEGRVVDGVALRAHHDDLARRRLRREALVDQRFRLLRLRIARHIAVGRQRVPE